MGAGDRRHRVTLETPTAARSGTGATTQTWSTYATLWAEIDWVDGIEQIQAGQVNVKQAIRLTIENARGVSTAYEGGLTAKMRVAYRGRYFEIQSIAPADGKNRKLVLNCLERSA